MYYWFDSMKFSIFKKKKKTLIELLVFSYFDNKIKYDKIIFLIFFPGPTKSVKLSSTIVSID